MIRILLWVQGAYFLVTGLWPILSLRTFIQITGEKTDNAKTGLLIDHWLVITVGVLVTPIGAALLLSAIRRVWRLETAILALGSAVGLLVVDVIYVSRRMIDPIYLADAGIEALLIVGWLIAGVRSRTKRT
ncbi:MAG: hypothetical protein ACJ8C4_03260 [Gemmataceae bacterium]